MADHTGGRITALRTIVTPEQFGASSSLNTFSINTSRLLITEQEQAEAKFLISQLRTLKQKSAVRRAAEKRGPFPFLDLSPELRLRCYDYTLGIHERPADERQDLATVSVPSIARVSTLIRVEFLPVFFAKTPFYITVAADLGNHASLRKGLLRSNNPALHDRCGVLKMRKQVKNMIRQIGTAALIRNLTLKICDGAFWTFHKGRPLPDYRLVIEVALVVERGKATSVVLERKGLPRYSGHLGYSSDEEAESAAEAAMGVANEIAARQGFKGFGLTDLERIVKKFRSGA